MRSHRLFLPLLLLTSAHAEPVTIAVASNFITPMAELVAAFEASSDERVRVSSASTGVLYAAIRNGAGYAAFMAADSERPRLLEAEGLGVPGMRERASLVGGELEVQSEQGNGTQVYLRVPIT